jgi:hypothetical protein
VHKRARKACADNWEAWGKEKVNVDDVDCETHAIRALAALARDDLDELVECPMAVVEEEKEEKKKDEEQSGPSP